MSDHLVLAEEPALSHDQTPLLITNQLPPPPPPRPPPPPPRPQQQGDGDTQLDETLQRLDTFLTLLGFNQSNALKVCLSWAVFALIGVALPVAILELSSNSCSGCETYQIKDFELDIVASQACLAAVSLLCLSHNLRKYGLRKFLFVDRFEFLIPGSRFHNTLPKLNCNESYNYLETAPEDAIRLLVLWVLPCFILKTAREVIRILYVRRESWWQSLAILVGLLVSWTYIMTIFLSACILFHMICYLQIIHFEDYGKFLERESDVLVFIEEHTRLRHHLSKISHRFRIYLVLEFLVVTASQFMTLFQTTGYSGIITFINGGDFAVSSIIQVVGITLCLNAAAKISHRAQGIASIASRWHAVATCSSTDASRLTSSSSVGNFAAAYPLGSLQMSNSESDLDSVDHIALPTNTQLASYTSSYHRRQAFVMYLQTNPGGITIFGWTVDRGLINTIFFIELSLVLFVLGKTIIFASKHGAAISVWEGHWIPNNIHPPVAIQHSLTFPEIMGSHSERTLIKFLFSPEAASKIRAIHIPKCDFEDQTGRFELAMDYRVISVPWIDVD
ncbi:hypothetical protein RJ640_030792 [Escallonia rubra]|uniref:Uncharacterized protein n=1 Tax=Escallonia rubra TaxID=112253 RepID=A0AA88UDA5_9ASTE|nr:hypothetical protein RJ640_030792 [Escallonia rubra]